MTRSIGPMWASTREARIKGAAFDPAPFPSSAMSLGSVIPWRVALQQSPPPLHRPESMLYPLAETVNHHRAGLEIFERRVRFSIGVGSTFTGRQDRAQRECDLDGDSAPEWLRWPESETKCPQRGIADLHRTGLIWLLKETGRHPGERGDQLFNYRLRLS